MINIGETSISAIYKGTVKFAKAYQGNVLIWSSIVAVDWVELRVNSATPSQRVFTSEDIDEVAAWSCGVTPAVASWKDVSGSGNDAIQETTNLQPTYSSANRELVFDGVNDSLDNTVEAALDYFSSRVIIKCRPTVNFSGLFAISDNDGRRYEVYVATLTQIRVFCRETSTVSKYKEITLTTPLILGEYLFIDLTFCNGADGIITATINGEDYQINIYNGSTISTVGYPNRITLGQINIGLIYNNQYAYKGGISSVRFIDKNGVDIVNYTLE